MDERARIVALLEALGLMPTDDSIAIVEAWLRAMEGEERHG